jgi:hypothetical protein
VPKWFISIKASIINGRTIAAMENSAFIRSRKKGKEICENGTMIRFPDLASIFLLLAEICLSCKANLEPHIEKIAVKVSTDKDQIVAALFLSPGSIELPLKEHVNASSSPLGNYLQQNQV